MPERLLGVLCKHLSQWIFPPVPFVSNAWRARAHSSFISPLSGQTRVGHQREMAAAHACPQVQSPPATPRAHLGRSPISFHPHGRGSQRRWLHTDQPLRCNFLKSEIYKKYIAGSTNTPGSCRWVSEPNGSHRSAAPAPRAPEGRMGESSRSPLLLCSGLETTRSPCPREQPALPAAASSCQRETSQPSRSQATLSQDPKNKSSLVPAPPCSLMSRP